MSILIESDSSSGSSTERLPSEEEKIQEEEALIQRTSSPELNERQSKDRGEKRS
jgi:hypothetical protein